MARVLVLHETYGCETGCCGHVVEVDGDMVGEFCFHHPGAESDRAYAEDLVREAGCDPADLDWDSCVIVRD